MNSNDSKDILYREPRVPFEAKVSLEFEKFSGFITEFSSNLSLGGMFIRTDDPKPIGTIVSFEFRLSDNFKLIQGLGEVVWIRTVSAGRDKPAGMGLRFHELDSQSKELIHTIVNQQLESGGVAFDLNEDDPSKQMMPDSTDQIELKDPPMPKGPSIEFSEEFSTESVEEISETEASEPDPESIEDEFKALFAAEIEDAEIMKSKPQEQEPEVPPMELNLAIEEESPIPLDEVMNASESTNKGKSGEERIAPIDMGVVDDDAPSTLADQILKEVSRSPQKKDDFKQISETGSPKATHHKKIARWISISSILLILGFGFAFQDRILLLLGIKTPTEAPQPKVLATTKANLKTAEGASHQTQTAEAKPKEPTPMETQALGPGPTPPALKEEQPAEAELNKNTEMSQAEEISPRETEKTEAPQRTIPSENLQEDPVTEKSIASKNPSPLPTSNKPTSGRLIETIVWQKRGSDTVVSIHSDTKWEKTDYEYLRIQKGKPREVIKITDVDRPYTKNVLPVGNQHLVQIRTGLGKSPSGSPQLSVVLDLKSQNVRLYKVSRDDKKLHLFLR